MASRASICVGDRVQFSDDECGAVLKPLRGKKRGPDRRVAQAPHPTSGPIAQAAFDSCAHTMEYEMAFSGTASDLIAFLSRTDAVVANRVELLINAFAGDDERAPSLVVAADPSTALGEAQAGASEALAAALSKGEEVACLSCLETLVPPIAFGTMEGSRQRPVSVGPHHTGDTTVHLLEDALMLAEKARGHVDVHIANRTLTDLQFEKANKWLQIECFEKYFMHSQALKERIRQFDRCPHQLSRSQKQAVRGSRRDAFKAWTKGLMGNTQLFHAVMRNGMFEVEDLQAFMVAFLQIRTEAETGASSGDSHSAAAPRLDDFLPRSVG